MHLINTVKLNVFKTPKNKITIHFNLLKNTNSKLLYDTLHYILSSSKYKQKIIIKLQIYSVLNSRIKLF